MSKGWVKIYRKLADKGYYKKSEYVHLWVHILIKANHKKKEFLFNNSIEIVDNGSFITGRKRLSDETGIAQGKVERILKCFENEQQIEQQKTNKYRRITIKNYDLYQVLEKSGQQNEQQVNNKWTTSGQQVDTNKNDKNYKNVKNEEKEKTREADNFDIDIFKNLFNKFETRAAVTGAATQAIIFRLKKIPPELHQKFIDRCDTIQTEIVANGKSRYGAEKLIITAMQSIDDMPAMTTEEKNIQVGIDFLNDEPEPIFGEF